MTTFAAALAAFDVRALSDLDVPVDDSGFEHDHTVPADRIWDGEREVASEHMFGIVYGATYGMSAHDKGDEDEGRVCYTCQTLDW